MTLREKQIEELRAAASAVKTGYRPTESPLVALLTCAADRLSGKYPADYDGLLIDDGVEHALAIARSLRS